MRTLLHIFACCLASIIVVSGAGPVQADLIWEDHFVDEVPIVDGGSLLAGGTNVTFSTTVFSDSDGGTFDLAPVRSANFMSFEAGQTGAHTGFLEMTFDNQNNDPADFLELTMSFSRAIENLSFSILDVDGQAAGTWDDAVEVFFNGVNVKTDSSLFTLGSAVFLDNETYMDGFEAGTTSAGATQTIGNIDFQFGAQDINTITVRYFSTDDAIADPGSQFIGIGDFSFTVVPVPEPAYLSAALLGLMVLRLHPRRSRARVV